MPTLTRAADYAAAGCLVKPLMHRFFQDPDWEFRFDLHLVRPTRRKPDGWFHSSTHPMATDEELYAYLAHPERHQPEQMSYVGCMSTMFGAVAHGVLGAALDRFGVTVPLPPGPCVACGRPRPGCDGRQLEGQCFEHGAIDPETRSRGHLDKILDFKQLGTHAFDLKTIKPYGLKGLPDMDPVVFREKWPKYYWQATDYMRMTGLRKFIVFFMGMGNPWEMREYHIPYDPIDAFAIEQKYRRVLAAGRQVIPA